MSTSLSAEGALNPSADRTENPSVPYLASVAEGYQRWASIYDCAPNPLLAREERYLLPLLGDVRNKRIVDLACGTGRWIEKLSAQGSGFGFGIDCSSAMLNIAAHKPGIARKLTQGTCESLPFCSAAFDLAICSFALGHMGDLNMFAREVSRVLKPGADLFLTDLHPDAYRHGWRVGFRDKTTAIEIPVVDRESAEVVATFGSRGLKCVGEVSLSLEEPEKGIFARAGKSDWFVNASQVPAIIAFHFRHPATPVELWET